MIYILRNFGLHTQGQLKGCGQVFRPIWKCSKIAEYWQVGFVLPDFALGCSSFLRKNICKKLSFPSAIFWRSIVKWKTKETLWLFCWTACQTDGPFIVYEVKIESHIKRKSGNRLFTLLIVTGYCTIRKIHIHVWTDKLVHLLTQVRCTCIY